MLSQLTKCVSAEPGGTRNPGVTNKNDIRYQSTANSYDWFNLGRDSQTAGFKIWVDPLDMWPTQNGIDLNKLGALDLQIAYARIWGFSVILTFVNNWPQWINGTTSPKTLPSSNGTSSAYASFFWYFASRYSVNNPNRPQSGLSYIDIIEPLNEPNHDGTAGDNTWATRSADMMLTALQIIAGLGNSPMVAGPATLDIFGSSVGSSPPAIDYLSFSQAVLDRLQVNGFLSQPNKGYLAWSHHNYGDVLYDLGSNSQYVGSNVKNPAWVVGDPNTARVNNVHLLLNANNWSGYPYILLTEGGAIPGQISDRWNTSDPMTKQGTLIGNNWGRMHNNSDGAGVALEVQYEYYTHAPSGSDPGFDSGLLNSPGSPRYSYGIFRTLPKT